MTKIRKKYMPDVNTSRTPEEGAHDPSWPNGLIIIVIIVIGKVKRKATEKM
jgi:hypothetical protein